MYQTGRPKILKVDSLRKWTVLKSERDKTGRSKEVKVDGTSKLGLGLLSYQDFDTLLIFRRENKVGSS